MARKTGGRLRALVFLLISMMAAVIATLVIYRVINRMNDTLVELDKEEEKIQVVAAATNLYQGNTITEQDLIIKEIPPAYVPDTAFLDPVQVKGRVPTERILANEFIREERLADPEAGVGLNAIIPQGMRAISLNITGGAAVSGFLSPGNFVDILVTITPEGDYDREVRTVTLLQAIQILAVDSRMGEGPSSANSGQGYSPSITLAVTPDQAERITHANSNGALTLTLRNDVDVTEVETHGATASRLIGHEDAPAVPIGTVRTKKNPDGSITLIRGGRETKITVGADGTIKK